MQAHGRYVIFDTSQLKQESSSLQGSADWHMFKIVYFSVRCPAQT